MSTGCVIAPGAHPAHTGSDLKMPRALETLEKPLAASSRVRFSALEARERCWGEELTTRETDRIPDGVMTGGLTTIKTLASYDFTAPPSLDP